MTAAAATIEPSVEPWRFSEHELVVGPAMHRTTAARAAMVLCIGTLILAALASDPLVEWANRLPTHPVAEGLIGLARQWHDLMASIGLTEFFSGLRDFFAEVRDF